MATSAMADYSVVLVLLNLLSFLNLVQQNMLCCTIIAGISLTIGLECKLQNFQSFLLFIVKTDFCHSIV